MEDIRLDEIRVNDDTYGFDNRRFIFMHTLRVLLSLERKLDRLIELLEER